MLYEVITYDHSGIDGRALLRAIIKRGIFQIQNSGGGSTITQQLAKQLYSPSADNIIERALQKPIEWVISVKLEKLYTKEEIITMYLNKFDFLNNAVGIKSVITSYSIHYTKLYEMKTSIIFIMKMKLLW